MAENEKLRAGPWVNIDDPFGIVKIFATHLELSLQHSHPEQAAKAAYAAVDSYLKSYSFIDTGTKDSEGPSYRMVAKRENNGMVQGR